MTFRRIALPAVALACLLPVAVEAAIPRPSPIAPANKASLARGKTPTFKARSTGDGTVWLHVSKSPKKNRDGVIKSEHVINQMKKKSGSTYTVKPKYYSYPGFWAATKGKYYWQVHRIACGEEAKSSDCKVEGPVRSFNIK
jgi:hypothetical protein